MEIELRLEEKSDYKTVENLTREAFWNVHFPGCDEHYLIHQLRKTKAFISELDFVAILNGEIVGNIVYAKAKITDTKGKEHEVLTFGPLSVLPKYQNKGIGGKLIKESLKKAYDMGFKAVLIYGDPDYYSRFGFVAAEKYGIRTSDGKFAPALLSYEICPDSLKDISGRFFEGESYEINREKAEEFEKAFPFKEKAVTKSQERFLELLKMVHD